MAQWSMTSRIPGEEQLIRLSPGLAGLASCSCHGMQRDPMSAFSKKKTSSVLGCRTTLSFDETSQSVFGSLNSQVSECDTKSYLGFYCSV